MALSKCPLKQDLILVKVSESSLTTIPTLE